MTILRAVAHKQTFNEVKNKSFNEVTNGYLMRLIAKRYQRKPTKGDGSGSQWARVY